MSGVLSVFRKFENSELNCLLTTIKDLNNDIWFFGNEFGITLGHTNPQRAIRDYVDESDKFYFQDLPLRKVTVSVTLQIHPHAVVISESGAYDLIFRSKLPKAKEFRKWVTKEVLPNIRKTGAYALPQQVPALPEVPIEKLRTITNQEIIELGNVEKKVFRYESRIKSDLSKNQSCVESGKRGGKEMQQRRRNIIDELDELKAKNINLNLKILRLKLEKKVLQDELDAIVDFVENF